MGSITEREVRIEVGDVSLVGTLTIPGSCIACVIFAHGSGGSRLSSRNRAMARALAERGCATLVIDLLTPREALDSKHAFDIELLGQRVIVAARWARRQSQLKTLRQAAERLSCERRARVVEGATHLFVEPGALEQKARWAGDWFDDTLKRNRSTSRASS